MVFSTELVKSFNGYFVQGFRVVLQKAEDHTRPHQQFQRLFSYSGGAEVVPLSCGISGNPIYIWIQWLKVTIWAVFIFTLKPLGQTIQF